MQEGGTITYPERADGWFIRIELGDGRFIEDEINETRFSVYLEEALRQCEADH